MMKKIFCLTLVFGLALFSVQSPISTAQMASPVTGTSAPVTVAPSPAVSQAPVASITSDLEKAGVVAAVKGKVDVKTSGQAARTAASGQPVFIGDEVTTAEGGHLQILLLDQTVFTIGANSTMIIDEFVYDPKTQNGKIKTSVTKGFFRYVSGKIGAKKPGNVSVKLPTATIGFRGTMVGGHVRPDNSSLAALLGPGDNNDAGERSGSFVMEGEGENGGGGQQEVNRTGFGVEAGADGGLSGVFQLSDSQMNGLTSGFSSSGDGGSGGGSGGGDGGDNSLGGGGSMGDMSGENNALTGTNANLIEGLNNLGSSSDDTSTLLAQDNLEQAAESGAIADGIATLADLTKIETGTYHYSGSSAFVYNYASYPYIGTIQGSIDINFGDKTIGGGNSFVTVSVSALEFSDTGYYTEAKNFSTASIDGVNAIFQLNTTGSHGGNFNTLMSLMNSGGTPATSATVSVSYTNSTNTGSGGFVGQREADGTGAT